MSVELAVNTHCGVDDDPDFFHHVFDGHVGQFRLSIQII
jgi:hypothetical protein